MDLDVTTIVVSPFQQNCRLVMDRASREAVLIDPGDDAPKILDVVREKGAEVVAIWNTHAHLDHAGAVAEVKKALQVPFALHGAERPILKTLPESGRMWGVGPREVPDIDLDLAGVDELPFAGGTVRVLETPGHTPGGVTFLFGDEGHFGDSLFRLSVGRTDLGGDPVVYQRTLDEVILALPDETVVHCGHGPSTTIGAERRENPFLNGQIRLV